MAQDEYTTTFARSGTGVLTSQPCIVRAVRIMETNPTPTGGFADFTETASGRLLCRLSLPTTTPPTTGLQFASAEHVFAGAGQRCPSGISVTVTGITTGVSAAEVVPA